MNSKNRKKQKMFLLLLLAILISLLIVSELYQNHISKKIDQYPYELVKKYDEFEIRRYKPTYFTTIALKNNGFENTSRKGFRVLSGYIFGENKEKRAISMTSPVIMDIEKNVTMKFMVPFKENPLTLPSPNSNDIHLEMIPEHLAAVITFGGWASDEKLHKYSLKLKAELIAKKIKHQNSFSFYGYNSPYQLTGRKNEIVIDLIESKN